MDSQALVVITSAAFTGGIVSIGTRWREFASSYDIHPAARFLYVMFKLLIGLAVAVLVLGMLERKMVTLSILDKDAFAILDSRDFKDYYESQARIPPEVTAEQLARIAIGFHTLYLMWVFGFLCGFTERFAWGFIRPRQRRTARQEHEKKSDDG